MENRKVQIVPGGKIKCVRGRIKCQRGKERITGKAKGKSAKEENQRLRGDRKRADSAEGEN